MELETKLAELTKVIRDHREVLLTEEAAKNALVMPFLQALGYNVFNPGEVVPEFTCDIGIKKGEKVDYAVCLHGQIAMLIECKPANSELNVSHASQLFRYFATTEVRVAVLTNGVVYKFFSDVDTPNRMDERPFFTFQLDAIRKADIRTLENFTKDSFDVEKIVAVAQGLKMQTLVARELEKEFAEPSEDFVRMIARRVHSGSITAAIKDSFQALIVGSIASLIRDRVNDRLTSALNVANPNEVGDTDKSPPNENVANTTQDEIDGFNIIRAIASRAVKPDRIVMRDSKSYCAILLDDNNRKTIARLHFNSPTARYLGTFSGRNETRNAVTTPVDLYQYEKLILSRLAELNN